MTKKVFVIIYPFLCALNNSFLFLKTSISVFLNIFKHNTTSLHHYNGKDVAKKEKNKEFSSRTITNCVK